MNDVTATKNVTGSRQAVAGSAAPAIGPRPIVGAASPTQCKICRSMKRAAVDLALASGATGRSVAATHGFSKSAIFRHAAKCLPAKVARANAERVEQISASTLLDTMTILQAKTQAQLDSAIASEYKPADVAKLIKEVRENVGMFGRLLGAFKGDGASTIVDNRIQIASIQNLSTDDLLALTSALRSKKAGGA